MVSVIPTREVAEFDNSQDLRIGDVLVNRGLLTTDEVELIVAVQRDEGLRFGEAARELGLIDEDALLSALSGQFGYPYVTVGSSDLSEQLTAAYTPFSPQVESLRGLRSQLMLRWFTEQRKCLTIVSARADEGASTVAANLAIVLAQLGERTLLIDANMRDPRQHSLFGMGNPDGLSDLLRGRSAFKKTLLPVPGFHNLLLLCAGAAAPNPHELLTQNTFAYVMETAPTGFDTVIIDAPPILEYPDSQMIVARSGGCILVTRRGETRLADIERARDQIEPTGAVLLGAVIS